MTVSCDCVQHDFRYCTCLHDDGSVICAFLSVLGCSIIHFPCRMVAEMLYILQRILFLPLLVCFAFWIVINTNFNSPHSFVYKCYMVSALNISIFSNNLANRISSNRRCSVNTFHSYIVNDCVLQPSECSLQSQQMHLPRGEIVYPGDL